MFKLWKSNWNFDILGGYFSGILLTYFGSTPFSGIIIPKTQWSSERRISSLLNKLNGFKNSSSQNCLGGSLWYIQINQKSFQANAVCSNKGNNSWKKLSQISRGLGLLEKWSRKLLRETLFKCKSCKVKKYNSHFFVRNCTHTNAPFSSIPIKIIHLCR